MHRASLIRHVKVAKQVGDYGDLNFSEEEIANFQKYAAYKDELGQSMNAFSAIIDSGQCWGESAKCIRAAGMAGGYSRSKGGIQGGTVGKRGRRVWLGQVRPVWNGRGVWLRWSEPAAGGKMGTGMQKNCAGGWVLEKGYEYSG